MRPCHLLLSFFFSFFLLSTLLFPSSSSLSTLVNCPKFLLFLIYFFLNFFLVSCSFFYLKFSWRSLNLVSEGGNRCNGNEIENGQARQSCKGDENMAENCGFERGKKNLGNTYDSYIEYLKSNGAVMELEWVFFYYYFVKFKEYFDKTWFSGNVKFLIEIIVFLSKQDHLLWEC